MDIAAAAPSPDDSPALSATRNETRNETPGPDPDPASGSTPETDSEPTPPAASTPDSPAAPDPSPARPSRRRRVGVLFAVAAAAYVLDLVSKLLVVAKLAGHDPIHLIGSAVQLTYIRNSGAAFSLGVGYTVAFSLIAVVVVVAIIRVSRRLYSVPWAIALGLLLGGALGNLTDRIARSPGFFRGWVVDFIDVPHFAVFNLADSAISVGGVLMVLLAFRGLHPDGTDERAAAAGESDAAETEPAPDKVER